MNNKYTKWVVAACFIFTALSLSGCQSLRATRMWLPPELSGMERVYPGLVIESPVTDADVEKVNSLQINANQLVFNAWKNRQASPELWVCKTPRCHHRFGGGTRLAAAFGYSRTYMSPQGQTFQLLAHEWSHAELMKRVGLLKVPRVPRWFDEGLAVWVSQDPRHGEAMYQRVLAEGITPPLLIDLYSFEDWDQAVGRYGDHLKNSDSTKVNVVYPTAGHEVSRWIGKVGVDGLHTLIHAVAQGHDFSTQYAELERQAKP